MTKNYLNKLNRTEYFKCSAFVELKLHVQWKANALPKVSFIMQLLHIITKNSFILGPARETLRQDNMNTCTVSEIKI